MKLIPWAETIGTNRRRYSRIHDTEITCQGIKTKIQPLYQCNMCNQYIEQCTDSDINGGCYCSACAEKLRADQRKHYQAAVMDRLAKKRFEQQHNPAGSK